MLTDDADQHHSVCCWCCSFSPRYTTGETMMPPSEDHADHGPACGLFCQICQSALSVPRAKASMRPSELIGAMGSLVIKPPSDLHVDCPARCATTRSRCRVQTLQCGRPSSPRHRAHW